MLKQRIKITLLVECWNDDDGFFLAQQQHQSRQSNDQMEQKYIIIVPLLLPLAYVMNIFVYISIYIYIHIVVLKNQCDIIYNSLLGVIVVVVI